MQLHLSPRSHDPKITPTVTKAIERIAETVTDIEMAAETVIGTASVGIGVKTEVGEKAGNEAKGIKTLMEMKK